MDTGKLDLSPLDPERDAEHWQATVDRLLERVDTAMEQRSQRQDDALQLIASWRRPLLVAAAIAIVILIPVEIALELNESRDEPVTRLAAMSASWAEADETPSGAEILRAIADGGRQ